MLKPLFTPGAKKSKGLKVLRSSEPPAPVCTGVQSKPKGCDGCPMKNIGSGFVPDYVPKNPKLAFLLEAPGGDEILNASPLTGKTGQMFFEKFLEPLGLKREDVAIFNTLRCRPPNNEYPTGAIRTKAERMCRQYDNFHGAPDGSLLPSGLLDYAPDCFVCTLHPASLLRSSAKTRYLRKQLEKAVKLSDNGYKVLVVMGDKALALVAPWTGGHIKHWDGHYWLGQIPWTQKGFKSA